MTWIIALIAFLILGALNARRLEKKEWNGGVCAKTGERWVHADMDSQGGRMYRTQSGEVCWISYNVDK